MLAEMQSIGLPKVFGELLVLKAPHLLLGIVLFLEAGLFSKS